MAKKRMCGEEARAALLAAATVAFAEHGFEGAKTLQIARAAQTTEAVMYRHFRSKEALYRAVLRSVIRSQNATTASLRSSDVSTFGLLGSIERYFRNSYAGSRAPNAMAMQILMRSLVHRGDFARLTYRRAAKLNLQYLESAFAAAEAAGDMACPSIGVRNAANFIEHVGAMMFTARMPDREIITYEGGEDVAVGEAVRFCARGVGIKDAAVDRYFAARHATPAIA